MSVCAMARMPLRAVSTPSSSIVERLASSSNIARAHARGCDLQPAVMHCVGSRASSIRTTPLPTSSMPFRSLRSGSNIVSPALISITSASRRKCERVSRFLIPHGCVGSKNGMAERMRPGDVSVGGSGCMIRRCKYVSCSACNIEPSDSSKRPVCVSSLVSASVTSRISRANASERNERAMALCECCKALSISTASVTSTSDSRMTSRTWSDFMDVSFARFSPVAFFMLNCAASSCAMVSSSLFSCSALPSNVLNVSAVD